MTLAAAQSCIELCEVNSSKAGVTHECVCAVKGNDWTMTESVLTDAREEKNIHVWIILVAFQGSEIFGDAANLTDHNLIW